MTDSDQVLLTPPAAAKMLQISPQTLANWRWRRIGPPFLRIGRLIRYRRRDVLDWLN